ncbi:hypothetical protein LJC58_02010 [Lachnospiraceae bacterium OttesenSCG-928-D06]|nr:hypothetical protein [Lachnospiraceae bacterium OttesenSCG-928-D06]
MKINQSSKFSDIYLFAYNSKSTMSLYFMAFVLLYLFLGKISVAASVVLDFPTAIQMLIASIFIGFGQEFIVPIQRLSMKRCIVWIAWATCITIGSVLALKWFDGFPTWCGIVFCILIILAFAALLLGLLFFSQRETKKLNEHLKAFQNSLR